MNFEKPDINFKYSLEEFKADLKGVKDAVRKRTFKRTPNIKIQMDNGEIREYEFDEKHPLFQQSEYFKQKYGEGTSIKYNLKFFAIQSFLQKNYNLLIQHKFLIDVNGMILEHPSFDDFLVFLLSYKVNSENGEISLKVFKDYFHSKQQN